jgi:hypothetical protein
MSAMTSVGIDWSSAEETFIVAGMRMRPFALLFPRWSAIAGASRDGVERLGVVLDGVPQ